MKSVKIIVQVHYPQMPNKVDVVTVIQSTTPMLVCSAKTIKIGERYYVVQSHDIAFKHTLEVDYVILNVL